MAIGAATRWGALGAAVLLGLYEAFHAPLILGCTAAIALFSFAWGQRSVLISRTRRRRRQRTAIEVTALLSASLWIVVFFVLRAADASDSKLTTDIPIGLNGEEISPLGFVVHGLVSTVAVIAALGFIHLWATRRRAGHQGRRRKRRSPGPTISSSETP